MTEAADPDAMRARFLTSEPAKPLAAMNVAAASRENESSRFSLTLRRAGEARVERNCSKYLLKGIIDVGAFGLIYGPRGSGKTFVALALSRAVSSGARFADIRTRKAGVLYLALESSAANIERRVAALAEAGTADAALYWDRVNAAAFADDGFLQCLARAIGRERIQLVILDTLTALIGERDENANAGMGFATRVADAITAAGAAALFVAHTGKDQARGVRGHSSVEGLADYLIRVERDGERRELVMEKVRDGPDGARFEFTLAPVAFGADDEGDAIATLVARDFRAAEGGTATQRKPVKGHAKAALDALTAALAVEGETLPAVLGLPAGLRGARCEAWRCRFYAALGDDDAEAKKKAFQRARDHLRNLNRVAIDGAWAWPL